VHVPTPSDKQPSVPAGGSDPAPRPTRRVFTPAYKRAMVAEYENAPNGEKRAILRREGLYSLPYRIRTGERELAGQLLDSVSEDMLIIADRGFFSYQMWSDFLETGADLLFRAWSTMKLTPVEVLADGTWIAEICKKSVQGGKTRILLDDFGDIRLAAHIRVQGAAQSLFRWS
jgi:hypothetical protein